MKFLKSILPIVLILLVSAYLRWEQSGLETLSEDEAQLSISAMRLAQYGEFTLRGVPMSVGTWHSPFSVYAYALPFSIAPDVRLGRLFTGALNVVATALLYLIGRRYLGWKAAMIAALLFAIHPEALFMSRRVLNTIIGPVFVLLYLWHSLRGYQDTNSSRLARVLHLVWLSLALQSHPASSLLVVVALFLYIHAWIANKLPRKTIIIERF